MTGILLISTSAAPLAPDVPAPLPSRTEREGCLGAILALGYLSHGWEKMKKAHSLLPTVAQPFSSNTDSLFSWQTDDLASFYKLLHSSLLPALPTARPHDHSALAACFYIYPAVFLRAYRLRLISPVEVQAALQELCRVRSLPELMEQRASKNS